MFFKHSIITIVTCCCLASLAAAVVQNPCDYVRCGYGANCVVTNGRPKCVCPSACPQVFFPICGSDGQTYGNSCFLKVSACKAKKNVTQVSEGSCPQNGQSTTVKPVPTVISPGIPQPSCD